MMPTQSWTDRLNSLQTVKPDDRIPMLIVCQPRYFSVDEVGRSVPAPYLLPSKILPLQATAVFFRFGIFRDYPDSDNGGSTAARD